MATPPDKKQAQALYNALISKNVDIGGFDDFYTKISEPEGVDRLVGALSKNNIDIGSVQDVTTKLYGTKPAEKKNDISVLPSTSGGGKQGYLSNALSSQFGAIPTVDEQPVKGVTKQQVADRFGAIPEVKEPAVFEKKAIPDITKNKSVEKTLTSYDAVKTATKNYDDAKANLDALISTGSDAQGNRLMGFDPSTGQIIPDSPADKYKKQLEADLDNARLNAENTIKDFQKNVPSAKKTQLSLDKPKGQEKTPIEAFVPPQEVQALEFVKDLSDAENYYKEVGLDINKAMDNALDIGASVFLDNDQRLLYDAIKSGDEKKYDEAKDYVYKEQLSRIAEIDKKLVTGGYNQDLLNEKRDLQAQMRDFFNPDAALKTVESSSPAMSAAAKIMGDIPAQDKLKLFYLKSFKEANDIALAKYGKPLFIEDKGRTVMNPDVRMDVENPFANEDEQGKKLREAIDVMKLTAPAAMINKRTIEKTGNFIESFGKGIINAFGYKDTDIATQPITQQSTAFKNILGDAGIKESDLALGQKKFLDKAEKQSVGEFAGQTLGYATALALTLPIGSAELKAIQGVSKAYNATRLGRGIEGLLGLANETSMLGRALKLGTEAKLAGMTFGDKADELGILNIGAESIGSEFIEKALGSTKAGKLFGRVLTNMFGSKAGQALRTIGRINAFGLAEATGETAGTLVQLYQDSDSFKEFQDRIAQQFGDPSEALKFFLAAYTMGGVLGGARSNASEAIDTQTKDAYEALSPEDKNIADAVIAQDKQAADEAIADVVDKAAPTLPDEVVKKQADDFTKAKEELDKVADGEAYSVKVGDAVFEGSTPEELQADKDMADHLANTYTNEQTEREAGKTETPAVQQPTGEDVGVGVTEEVIKETPEKVNLGQGVIKPNDRINKKIFIHETNAENIDKFDISKSGTGQGEAWLGRGIYLQESGTFKLEKYGKNKIEVSLSPSSKIFEVTETPDGEFRDSLVEWAVKNTDAGKRKYEQRLKDGLDAKGILPRDILKRNPEVVDKLKEAGYDGLYQDGELVVYNPDVLKINKSKQTTEILPQEGLIKETPQNLNQAEPIVKAEEVQTSPMGETVQVKETVSEKKAPLGQNERPSVQPFKKRISKIEGATDNLSSTTRSFIGQLNEYAENLVGWTETEGQKITGITNKGAGKIEKLGKGVEFEFYNPSTNTTSKYFVEGDADKMISFVEKFVRDRSSIEEAVLPPIKNEPTQEETQPKVTEPTKAPVIKAQVVGTTNGFNTIIDGGLGKQQDPRFTGEVQQGKSIFKVNPNNNESSFLDISLPSSDSFGRSGGVQIRFELPNGVDANTVFEAVKKEAAKLGRLDAKDPDFKSKVQGLVDKGIAEIQGLATGGAGQTAQVKETITEKQVPETTKQIYTDTNEVGTTQYYTVNDNGNVESSIEISTVGSDVVIDNANVIPTEKRKGLASSLVDKIIKDYQGKTNTYIDENGNEITEPYKIKLGTIVSDEGTAFAKSLNKKIEQFNESQDNLTQPKVTEQVNPSLFSSSAATREKALRDVSPEMKEKVRKVNEVLSKENIPALVKAMENNPELFEKKYGLVKIC